MTERRGFRPIHFLFGMLMGAADIVPGISGGTMALILGFYGRLIGSIRAAAIAATDLVRGRRRTALVAFGEIEWGLVLPVGVGIVVALIAGARVIEPLLENYPIQVRSFFFGLIAASIAIPWRAIVRPGASRYVAAVIAAFAAFLLTGFPPREVLEPPLLAVFFAAMIAICAMILPGISGAFLLLAMGMYEPTLEALNARDLTYIVVFSIGALIGLGGFSKVIFHLLNHYHDVTMAVLVGLMIGSLRALWPYQDAARGLLLPPDGQSLAMSLLLAAGGFVIVWGLTRLGDRAVAAATRAAPQPDRR